MNARHHHFNAFSLLISTALGLFTFHAIVIVVSVFCFVVPFFESHALLLFEPLNVSICLLFLVLDSLYDGLQNPISLGPEQSVRRNF